MRERGRQRGKEGGNREDGIEKQAEIERGAIQKGQRDSERVVLRREDIKWVITL